MVVKYVHGLTRLNNGNDQNIYEGIVVMVSYTTPRLVQTIMGHSFATHQGHETYDDDTAACPCIGSTTVRTMFKTASAPR